MLVCGFLRVRRFLGCGSLPPTADSTPFLCSCAKKRGGAPKKRAYGCRHGRCWVPPASPTDSKPQHHRRLRQADLSARSTHRVQINLTHQFVPLGLTPKWERRAGPPSSCGGFKGAFLWRLDTVSFGKHQRNGVESQDKVTKTSQRNGAHVQSVKKRDPRGGGPFLYQIAHRLSPKSARNLATSFCCQSLVGSRRPKKKRRLVGSSTQRRPPTSSRFSKSHVMRSTA